MRNQPPTNHRHSPITRCSHIDSHRKVWFFLPLIDTANWLETRCLLFFSLFRWCALQDHTNIAACPCLCARVRLFAIVTLVFFVYVHGKYICNNNNKNNAKTYSKICWKLENQHWISVRRKTDCWLTAVIYLSAWPFALALSCVCLCVCVFCLSHFECSCVFASITK